MQHLSNLSGVGGEKHKEKAINKWNKRDWVLLQMVLTCWRLDFVLRHILFIKPQMYSRRCCVVVLYATISVFKNNWIMGAIKTEAVTEI